MTEISDKSMCDRCGGGPRERVSSHILSPDAGEVYYEHSDKECYQHTKALLAEAQRERDSYEVRYEASQEALAETIQDCRENGERADALGKALLDRVVEALNYMQKYGAVLLERDEAQSEAKHWKDNHDNQVRRKRLTQVWLKEYQCRLKLAQERITALETSMQRVLDESETGDDLALFHVKSIARAALG